MIDLRDTSAKKLFFREYLMRISSVLLFALSLLLLANALLMTPLLMFLRETVADKEQILALLKQGDTSDVGDVENKLEDLEKIIALAETPSEETLLSKSLEHVFESMVSGVRVLGIEYSRENENTVLVISGVARTRPDLLLFVKTLEERDDIIEATYPVSNLAKEENLEFTVTARGAL